MRGQAPGRSRVRDALIFAALVVTLNAIGVLYADVVVMPLDVLL